MQKLSYSHFRVRAEGSRPEGFRQASGQSRPLQRMRQGFFLSWEMALGCSQRISNDHEDQCYGV